MQQFRLDLESIQITFFVKRKTRLFMISNKLPYTIILIATNTTKRKNQITLNDRGVIL